MSVATKNNCSMTVTAMLAMLLSGCYSTVGHVPDPARFPEPVPGGALDFIKQDKSAKARESLPVARRLALVDAGAARLYTFRAMGQSLRVTMDQFARAHKLNVIFDQDVTGVVNVEFHDVTLEQALDSILNPMGLGWLHEDGVIRITAQLTKTYQIDYLRAARTGSTMMSSSSSGSGATGSNSISKTDSINFWAELEAEIRSLLARDAEFQAPAETSTTTTNAGGTVTLSSHAMPQAVGRVTLNKISGTLQITTTPRRMKAVDEYIQNLLKGINRQVYIEARILDVTLTDDAALGIDWSNISFGANLSLNTANTIAVAAGGIAVQPPTGVLNYNKALPNNFLVKNIAGAIKALEQQGAVRVVSQPKVRTLNNQPAIMKVGTDRTFYTVTGGAQTISNGIVITSAPTETATVVTEGVMLSVTPQISSDGYITLDVMPVINKIIGITTSANGSTSPTVETKQATTLVRLKDGETTVIGGLIQESDSETGRSVPGLGDIPVAGWMFKGKYSNKVRKELVIFITPHLIEN